MKRAIKELRQVGAIYTMPRKREDGSTTSLDYYLWPKSAEMGAIVTYGEGNYALRGDKNLTYGGVDSDLTRRSINEGTPETEPQLPITPPTASEEVLGLVDVLRSHLDDNGLPQFEATKAQLNGLRIMLKEEDLEVVTDVLNWACQDSFWHAVILTPLTFKKHYATLKSRFKLSLIHI